MKLVRQNKSPKNSSSSIMLSRVIMLSLILGKGNRSIHCGCTVVSCKGVGRKVSGSSGPNGWDFDANVTEQARPIKAPLI